MNEPRLPSFLDEVTLRHLLIGNGSADIVIRRSGRNVVVDVIDRNGNIRVLHDGMAGWVDRARSSGP